MTQILPERFVPSLSYKNLLSFSTIALIGALLLLPQQMAGFQNQTAVPSAKEQVSPLPSIELAPEKSIDRELAGDQTQSYRVSLAANQTTSISVEQKGVQVVIEILDNGKKIASIESQIKPEGQEHFLLTADQAIVYELRARAKYPRIASGHYQIKASAFKAATDQDRSTFDAYKLDYQAAVLSEAGKYDDSIPLSQKALAAAEKGLGHDDAYVGELSTHLGGMQKLKGEFANSVKSLQGAIAINEHSLGKDDPQTGLAEDYLGTVYTSLNDDANAEKLMRQGLETLQKSLGPDHPRVASCLAHLSFLHQSRGDFKSATEEQKRAVAVAQKSLAPDDIITIGFTHNLANIYLNQGNYQDAEPIFEQVTKLIEHKYGPDSTYLASPLQNLGSIERVKKDYPRSLDYLWRAEKIREHVLGPQHPDTAALLINIGNVYKDQHDYPKAIEQFHRAFEILEVSAGPYHDYTLMSLANIADTSILMGNEPQAVEYQAKADKVVEKKLELNLAVGSERQVLSYGEWLNERTDRTISLNVLRDAGDPAATELAATAVLQHKGRVLDALSGTSAALRRRMKPDDQKLLDDLAGTDADLAKVALRGAGKTPPEQYKKNLAALDEKRESLEAEVNARSAGYFEQTSPVTLSAIRAAIPDHAVLIEFAIFHPYDPTKTTVVIDDSADPHYVVYVIPHSGAIQWKDLGLAKAVDESLDALRQALRDPDRTDVKQLARVADEKIFQPILAFIGDNKQLLISPDGELGLVPIEAFTDENGHYLAERYSISYLTSGRDLPRMLVARASKSEPLVIADPLFGEPGAAGSDSLVASASQPAAHAVKASASASGSASSSGGARRSVTTASTLTDVYFAPLAGTTQEGHTIQQLFPQTKLVTGREATKDSLKQVDAPSILHIATHGFFLGDPVHNPAESGENKRSADEGAKGTLAENPLLRSGLAFAGANLRSNGKDDGILTALEAANLNLWGTQLVTLSACDTGVGEVKTGEGIYGLRQAFFRAGAETLVMSLWPVSDNVTREMMATYYTGLKHGLGRGEALHQAELSMLKKKGRQHPFYWASFIQAGDWRSLNQKADIPK